MILNSEQNLIESKIGIPERCIEPSEVNHGAPKFSVHRTALAVAALFGTGSWALWIGKIINIFGKLEKIAHLLNREKNYFNNIYCILGNSVFSLFEKFEILNCFRKKILRHLLRSKYKKIGNFSIRNWKNHHSLSLGI